MFCLTPKHLIITSLLACGCMFFCYMYVCILTQYRQKWKMISYIISIKKDVAASRHIWILSISRFCVDAHSFIGIINHTALKRIFIKCKALATIYIYLPIMFNLNFPMQLASLNKAFNRHNIQLEIKKNTFLKNFIISKYNIAVIFCSETNNAVIVCLLAVCCCIVLYFFHIPLFFKVEKFLNITLHLSGGNTVSLYYIRNLSFRV